MSGTLFVGSFPPRACGIATFTKDIVDSYDRHIGSRSNIIAIDDPAGESCLYESSVVGRITQNDRRSYYTAAAIANRHPSSTICIQHEFGLFGGAHGEWCVDFVDAVRKPVSLTMHTVLPDPEPSHLKAVRRLCESVMRVVVLAATGREILIDRYGIGAEKVVVIPHGIPDVAYESSAASKKALTLENRTIVSTFGLINSGKGLEYAIEAIHEVAQTHPEVLYLILGATHPVVKRSEGENYRMSLQRRVDELGLHDNVRMIDRYLTFDEVVAFLQATDIYLTPYLNADQIVSGTLAYALGVGRAIVSTPYLYARELLADGRGILAGFRDSHSLASGVKRFLDDPGLRERTQRLAYEYGRNMTWDAVAAAYAGLFEDISSTLLSRSHSELSYGY
jgi:glycosyltransferase involved in cell wall biosynthesis